MSTPRNPIPPKHFAPLQSTDVKSCPRMSKPTWGKRERIRILFYVLPHMVLFFYPVSTFHCLAGFHHTNSVFCSFLPFPFLQGRHCSNRSGRHGKSFTSPHLPPSFPPSLSLSTLTITPCNEYFPPSSVSISYACRLAILHSKGWEIRPVIQYPSFNYASPFLSFCTSTCKIELQVYTFNMWNLAHAHALPFSTRVKSSSQRYVKTYLRMC